MTEAPKVVFWQKAYCVFLAIVYLLCAAAGALAIVFRESLADAKTSATEQGIVGAVFLAVSLPLAALYGAGPFLPRRPWAWVLHLVLIGLSMTSCACLPFALPLLIFWIRADAQAWFGRAGAVAVPGAPLAPPPRGG